MSNSLGDVAPGDASTRWSIPPRGYSAIRSIIMPIVALACTRAGRSRAPFITGKEGFSVGNELILLLEDGNDGLSDVLRQGFCDSSFN